MAKLTLEELHALREREQAEIKKRDIHGRNRHIVVAMGTTGLEHGAKLILNEFADLCEAKGLDNVIITQCGRIEGAAEPTVEVHTPDLGLVCYGAVEKKDVERIIDETVIGGRILSDKQIKLAEQEA